MKRRLVVALLISLASPPAEAVRLLTCGFEENSTTQTMWNSNAGNAVSIVTTSPHSGTYRMDTSNLSSNSSYLSRTLSSAKTSGTLFERFYWRTSTATPSGNTILWKHVSNGGQDSLTLTLLTTGKIRLTNAVTTTTADTTNAVTGDTFFCLKTRHLLSDTVGEMELRLYSGECESGTLLDDISITGEDTLPTDVSAIRVGKQSNITVTFSYDDIAINDDLGTFQNSWTGPGKIALVKPSSDTSVAWTKSGSSPAATNFGGVSEVPGAPDDGVTFNASTSGTQTDQLGITSLPAEVPTDADIILVDIYGRQGSNGTSGTRTITYEIWDESSVNTHGPTCSASMNGWRIAATSEHQVFDAGSRTRANINGFSIGYRRTGSGTTEERVTALWANVEWTTSSALATARRAVIQW